MSVAYFPTFPLSRGHTRSAGFYQEVRAAHAKIISAILVGFRYAEQLVTILKNPIPNKPPPTRMPAGIQRNDRKIDYAAVVTPTPSSRGKAPVRGGKGGGIFSKRIDIFGRDVSPGHPHFHSACKKKEEIDAELNFG